MAVSLDVTRDVMTLVGDQHKRSRKIPLCCRDDDVMLNSGAYGQYTHTDVIHRVQWSSGRQDGYDTVIIQKDQSEE